MAEVERQRVRVFRVRAGRGAEHPLRLRIGLDERDPFGFPTGEAQVFERLVVDRKDAAGRSVLRRHVGERRPIGERQARQSATEEFDELADHSLLAEHLRDGQHEIRGGRARGELADELEPDDLRDQQRHRLAEHGGFGFDPTDAPAEHAESVHHRGMAVGSDQRIGVGFQRTVGPTVEHDAREVLEIHLVHDPRIRRYDVEVGERRLSPPQERVALLIALELDLRVAAKRVAGAEVVDLHGMVDHQLGGKERVDLLGVSPQSFHRSAHRRQVHHARYAREILQQHARRHERDLSLTDVLGLPASQSPDVVGVDRFSILAAEQVLEQDLQRIGEALHRKPGGVEPLEAVERVRLVADVEGPTRLEAVLGGAHGVCTPRVPSIVKAR